MNGYTLYLPFQLPINHKLSNPLPHEGRLLGYPCRLIENRPYYAVVISSIESESTAQAMLEKLSALLHWTAINLGTAVRFNTILQEVDYVSDPVELSKNLGLRPSQPLAPIDALIDGAKPAIYHQEKSISRLTVQPISLSLGFSPSTFLKTCNQANSTHFHKNIANKKLALAFEVYSCTKFNIEEQAARFVMLCTVLEILAPNTRSSNLRIKAIDLCCDVIDKEIGKISSDRPKQEDLNALKEGVLNLRNQSISTSIASYVEKLLTRVGHSDPQKFSNEAKYLYRLRGKVVHKGALELGGGLAKLETLIKVVLMAALQSPNESEPQ